jgi:cell division septation protein DedD
LAHLTQDDGFHEIQLNGKQLVFLFMAATVVSVVIFLCGVLVGRGVRAERGTAGETSASSDATSSDIAPGAQAAAPAPAVPAGSDPTAAAPPPAVDDLSYFKRLERPNQPPEELQKPDPAKKPDDLKEVVKAAAPRPAVQPAAAPAAVAAKAAAPPAAPAVNASSSAPGDPGYAVQIAALNVRSEADAIAKRLTSKGYAAYVLTPATGTPSVFRVRVGTFKTRREAESIATKLEKEEQFKPWVTR